MSLDADTDWGILPAEVIRRLQRREWDDLARLKSRLLDERAFPIRMALKPPTAKQAMADLPRFQQWISEWKSYPEADRVEWQQRRYRPLGEQPVPVAIVIRSLSQLASTLGANAVARTQSWEPLMSPLLMLVDDFRRPALYRALVQRLEQLERLSGYDSHLLAMVIPQLDVGMGGGCYLRALPLKGVDTKFVEAQQVLVSQLLDVVHDGTLSEAGGLYPWLGCQENPRGWLVVKPLCARTRSAFGGLSVLQLPVQDILKGPLPARRILVVENLQSGLALPELPDTIAIAGGGRNVTWMAAAWMKSCQVGYWGDIDTWGLKILSDARACCPHLQALMMDRSTWDSHELRRVDEPEPCKVTSALSTDERDLYDELRRTGSGQNRLEQERLSADWIAAALTQWQSITE